VALDKTGIEVTIPRAAFNFVPKIRSYTRRSLRGAMLIDYGIMWGFNIKVIRMGTSGLWLLVSDAGPNQNRSVTVERYDWSITSSSSCLWREPFTTPLSAHLEMYVWTIVAVSIVWSRGYDTYRLGVAT
jgi:hypothetical protein